MYNGVVETVDSGFDICDYNLFELKHKVDIAEAKQGKHCLEYNNVHDLTGLTHRSGVKALSFNGAVKKLERTIKRMVIDALIHDCYGSLSVQNSKKIDVCIDVVKSSSDYKNRCIIATATANGVLVVLEFLLVRGA